MCDKNVPFTHLFGGKRMIVFWVKFFISLMYSSCPSKVLLIGFHDEAVGFICC